MSSYLVRLSGQAINLAALVAPAVAGRAAFRLFSTTRSPRPADAKARRFLETAQARMREAERLQLPTAGGHVAVHRFAPIGAPNGQRLMVIHGWGSRVDYMQTLVTGLRQDGAEVIGLDLPGHGGSTGRLLTVPMAIEAIDAVWRQYQHFDAVIGHSFGGFVAAMAAGAPSDWLPRRTPDRLVLIAAPVAAIDVFDGYARHMRYSRRVQRALADQAGTIVGRPLDFFAADRMLANVPDLPVLVLHAEDDKEVSSDAARRYEAAGAHVELAWMNGLGHRRIVSSPETIEAISKFLGSSR